MVFRGSRYTPWVHRKLEPCPLLVLTGLPDGDSGDREDLLHEEQSKAGFFPYPFEKIFSLSDGGMPIPSSSITMVASPDSRAEIRIVVTLPPCWTTFPARLWNARSSRGSANITSPLVSDWTQIFRISIRAQAWKKTSCTFCQSGSNGPRFW